MTANIPGHPSEEANETQLQLARHQGETYRKALEEMVNSEADTGGQQIAGDYLVAYAIEEAEGMYVPGDSGLAWHNPDDENAHIEVAVADARDGRFVPYLSITATLSDANGAVVGSHAQPFMWHSWLYHYGRNWTVPASGTYTLKVEIEPPEFHRHDKGNGARYGERVEVVFEDVMIEVGQKKA